MKVINLFFIFFLCLLAGMEGGGGGGGGGVRSILESYICKPSTASRVGITVSNSPNYPPPRV